MSLDILGFDPHFWSLPSESKDLRCARVVQEQRGTYNVAFSVTEQKVAEVSGAFRHRVRSRADYPAVGDFVLVEEKEGRFLIREVLLRKTKLSRKEAGLREEEQIMAANVDLALIVSSINMEFNLKRLDRFVVLSLDAGITPVLLLSKIDLDAEYQDFLKELSEFHKELKVIPLSNKTGEGLVELRQLLVGKTAVLMGRSGVGKSTLVNSLIGNPIQQTQEIRDADAKGRHTTTARSLFVLPTGGIIIDTPGVRELQLWDLEGSADETFEDIQRAASECRFGDCTHRSEPGCQVRARVEAGEIEMDRYESYLKIASEKSDQVRRQDRSKVVEKKQKAKVMAKALNKFYKADKKGW